MKEPLISVIIPAYNAEQTIGRCIDSICQSTYKNIEIICVDDGSKDNTYQIISDYPDNRIVLIKQENRGVSVARNTGIEASNGEYISFVDADDMVGKTMLSELYKIITRGSDIDIVGCSFSSYLGNLDNGEQKSVGVIKDAERVFNDFYFKTYSWGKLYRRESIGDLRFAEGIGVGEDKIFLTELKNRCRKAGIIDLKMYYYYQNPKSVMHGSNPYLDLDKNVEYCLEVMDKSNPTTQRELLIRAYKYAFSYRYMNRKNPEYKKINNKFNKILQKCKVYSDILPFKIRIIYIIMSKFPVIYDIYQNARGVCASTKEY